MSVGDEPSAGSNMQVHWKAYNFYFGQYRRGAEVQGTKIRLKFESRDYSLRQLQDRLSELASLIIVAGDVAFHLGEAVQLREDAAEAERFNNILRNRTRRERTAVRDLADVEGVSLSSPLELLLWIPLVGTGVAMLPKLIAVRNDWNESRVKKSNSDLRIAQNERAKYKEKLKLKILESIAEESPIINPEQVNSTAHSHPSKSLLHQSLDLLEELELLEVGPEVTKNKRPKK